MVKLYIDAGHGGADGGASSNGLLEKNITLSLAKKIEALLKKDYEDVEIMQTRTTDVFLELDERTNKANRWGADCFLSLHCNSATSSTAKGFETFVYLNPEPRTQAFQNVMHSEIIRQLSGVVNRGSKTANFHVLRESNMIALLSENLFLSNPSDATRLKSDEFLDKIALGHVNGLAKFYGLKKKIAPSPAPSPAPEVALYQVIAGTFSSRENAEKQADKLKNDGYNAYVIKKE